MFKALLNRLRNPTITDQTHTKVYPFKPQTAEKLWCNCCDAYEVDSKDPKTGLFFLVWGQPYLGNRGISEDYIPLCFALCAHCVKDGCSGQGCGAMQVHV